jgi:hypothetical protein
MMRKQAKEAFGVFTVDPGGKTGAASGVFLPQDTLAATIRAHSVNAYEFEGDSVEQAFRICEHYIDFQERCKESGIDRVELVIEDFNLRQMAVELSTVEVTYALKAFLFDWGITDEPVLQSASAAKSFGTAQRLKHWGLYRLGRGSDHKRDALRHLALRVSVIIDER